MLLQVRIVVRVHQLDNNNLLQMAIDVEKKYINHKLNFYNSVLKKEISRLLLLESRLNTQE